MSNKFQDYDYNERPEWMDEDKWKNYIDHTNRINKRRRTVKKMVLDGHTQKEIAKIVGVSATTVRNDLIKECSMSKVDSLLFSESRVDFLQKAKLVSISQLAEAMGLPQDIIHVVIDYNKICVFRRQSDSYISIIDAHRVDDDVMVVVKLLVGGGSFAKRHKKAMELVRSLGIPIAGLDY